MKKLVSMIVALSIISTVPAASALAEGSQTSRVVGMLAKSNMEAGDLDAWLEEVFERGWQVFEDDRPMQTEYFDDLPSMLLALNAGTIDELTLPRFAAEYVVRTNPDLKISGVERMPYDMTLHFGFRDDEGGEALQERINEAIGAMKADGTLDALEQAYLKQGTDEDELAPVQFDTFPESDETIRVAVTGDMPPMDYIDPSGVPAGFNTAVLSEVGRRIGANIELVSMQSASRTLSLVTGVADAVFWYMKMPDATGDMPDGLLFSDAYLDFDIWLYLCKSAGSGSAD